LVPILHDAETEFYHFSRNIFMVQKVYAYHELYLSLGYTNFYIKHFSILWIFNEIWRSI